MNFLEIENLKKTFGRVHAIKDVSMNVKHGEIVGILGPNGSGKTTLFDLISGVLWPDSGVIRLGGVSVAKRRVFENARCGVARSFQAPRTFSSLTVFENLLFAGSSAGETVSSTFLRWKSKDSGFSDTAKKVIERIGLAGHSTFRSDSLSTGQKRRLELGMMFMRKEATLLLLDEASVGLDREMVDLAAEMIFELRENGKTIMLIDHNLDFIEKLSDRVIVLDSGINICEGRASDVLRQPVVMKAYLGN